MKKFAISLAILAAGLTLSQAQAGLPGLYFNSPQKKIACYTSTSAGEILSAIGLYATIISNNELSSLQLIKSIPPSDYADMGANIVVASIEKLSRDNNQYKFKDAQGTYSYIIRWPQNILSLSKFKGEIEVLSKDGSRILETAPLDCL